MKELIISNFNIFKDKKVFFITHVDLDGVGCFVLAKYFLSTHCSKIEYFGTDDREFQNFDFSKLSEFDYVVITDLTILPHIYDKFKEYCKNIYIFDHHITGIRQSELIDGVFLDETKSATLLFYEWITEGMRKNYAVEEFVKYCDTYDMWKDDTEDFKTAKRLNYVLYGTKKFYLDSLKAYSFFVENQITKFGMNSEKFFFSNLEQEKIEKAEIKEREMYKKARNTIIKRKDSEGNIYGYFELPSKLSIVSNMILKQLTILKYVVIYNTYRKKELKISIRSRRGEGVDVSRIAEKWGGGGHKEASAFKFENMELLENFKKGKMHLI